jgi:predicted enzyme related to lactoylglutathione lyase
MARPTITGRFVWHELHTSDRAKAAKFYSQLVGWETKDVPMGPGEPYTLILRDGKDFGGITKSKAPAGVPPHWLPYVGVEDVDAFTKKATGLGAKVQNPPMDIPDAGRFAVLADPQGAVFALYKHAKPYGEEPEVPPPGAFCWDEVMAEDPQASAKFYQDLFGYSVQTMDMGPGGAYRILKRGDRQTAGVMKKPDMVPRGYWLSYIATKDVDASTRRAGELGAQVMVQPQDIPNVGRFSVLTDPTGAAIALFKGTPK